MRKILSLLLPVCALLVLSLNINFYLVIGRALDRKQNQRLIHTKTEKTKQRKEKKAKYYSECVGRQTENTISCYVKRYKDTHKRLFEGKSLRETLNDIVSHNGGKCCGLSHNYISNPKKYKKCRKIKRSITCLKPDENYAKYGDPGLEHFVLDTADVIRQENPRRLEMLLNSSHF